MIDASALNRHSLFGGLLSEQMDRILPLMGQDSYAAGEPIIREGEPNDRIRFMLSGRVAVSKGGVRINELGEGETFGEMEVLDVMPSVATVAAIEPTTVATISNRALREIYRGDPKAFSLILMNLARDLSRRLRRMDELMCSSGGASR